MVNGEQTRQATIAATADQPAPQANARPAVWELVIADVEDGYGGLAPLLRDRLIADMRERDAIGRKRYGTPLQPFNGRDALVDAYQESLDLVVYIRQAWYEAKDSALAPAYRMALALAAFLRRTIAKRDGK